MPCFIICCTVGRGSVVAGLLETMGRSLDGDEWYYFAGQTEAFHSELKAMLADDFISRLSVPILQHRAVHFHYFR